MSRRTLLRASALLAGGAAMGGAGITALAGCGPAERSSPPVLRLTAPTGPHPIGRVSRHLVDSARVDPLAPGKKAREVMVYLWYPAAEDSGELAPWMGAAAAAKFRDHLVLPSLSGSGPPAGASAGPPEGPPSGLPTGSSSGGPVMRQAPGGVSAAIRLGAFEFPLTHARSNAPARSGPAAPVVVWSPGHGDPAALGTELAEELASQGYVVVAIDHPYDAEVVEFPGGRVVEASMAVDIGNNLGVRIADVRFVLDRLAARKLIDTRAVGIMGHSLGGSTAAGVMAVDQRVRAGVDLDGSMVAATAGTKPAALAAALGERPFLLMTGDGHGPDGNDPTIREFWSGLTGWRRWLGLTGAAHGSFTDRQTLLAAVAELGLVDAAGKAAIAASIGTVDPVRSVAAQRAHLTAFFDLHLRGEDRSPAFPEMRVLGD